MKKIKESSNDHIYLLDHANKHCGEQTDGEVSKGSRDSQNLSQVCWQTEPERIKT